MRVMFNYYLDGDYRVIILDDGESKEYRAGGPTDEGWSYSAWRFTNEGDVVRLEAHSEGSDCDGRIDHDSEFVCPIADLDAYETPDGVKVPEFQRERASQRDYAAEAAGY